MGTFESARTSLGYAVTKAAKTIDDLRSQAEEVRKAAAEALDVAPELVFLANNESGSVHKVKSRHELTEFRGDGGLDFAILVECYIQSVGTVEMTVDVSLKETRYGIEVTCSGESYAVPNGGVEHTAQRISFLVNRAALSWTPSLSEVAEKKFKQVRV
ncbi:hypothetical protein AB4Z48_18125 [Cupriavidus sp. 2TAF22]|uniref:hypothetical protein n=1 Tax=unclassified Cupriavidus TaxID=2640874 RepID=UPI003F918CD0